MTSVTPVCFDVHDLGTLTTALGGFDPKLLVTIDCGGVITSPGRFHSYRGSAEDLAIIPADPSTRVSAGELARRLSLAQSRIFDGYKGGHYQMSPRSRVWVSVFGEAEPWQVIGATTLNGVIVILTQNQES